MSTSSFEIPRRELAFRDERGGFSLTLKRNCSISPGSLARVFAMLALVVLGIGAGFVAAGAWLIMPFAGLEALALGAAFVLYARRAADRERIALSSGRLTLEVTEAERTARYQTDSWLARVRLEREGGRGAKVLLVMPRREVEIGRHLDAESRVELAAELAKRLRI